MRKSDIDSNFHYFRFEAIIDTPHSDENGTNVGYSIPKGIITFDHKGIDRQGNMNITSGTFTAPNDGVYLFEIDGHKWAGNLVAEIDVQQNNVLQHKILHLDDGNVTQIAQITSFWTLEMKSGDQVRLVNQQENSLFIQGNPAYYSFSFTGLSLT